MTAEEYFATSFEGDRTQLIDGQMVVNEPLLDHDLAQTTRRVGHVDATRPRPRAGAAPRRRASTTSTRPTSSGLREERVPEPVDGRLVGLPDLAVEIRSPSTWRYVLGTKKARYDAGGLPELWLVDTLAHSVLVYRRSRERAGRFDVELELAGSDELGSPLLPGFAVSVERLFERP